MKRFNSIIAAVFALFVLPVVADTTIKMQAGDEQKKQDMTIYILAGKVRYDFPGAKGYTVWDSQSKSLTHVMSDSKKFMVMDEAYIEQMAQLMGQMSGMMAQMGGNAMFGDMAKKMQAANQEANKERHYKKTTRSGTVMNQSCRIWEVFNDTVKEGEFCAVSASVMKLNDSEMATMKAMAEFGKRLGDAMKGAMKMPGMPEAKQPEFAQLFEGNEFPAKYIRTDREPAYTAMEYKEVHHSAIDAGLFVIPAGFQKIEMKMPH